MNFVIPFRTLKISQACDSTQEVSSTSKSDLAFQNNGPVKYAYCI